MRKRIVFALLVLLLANIACVAQYRAASFSADVQDPPPTTEPVPKPTAWIVIVNTGETWNVRDASNSVVRVAYGGEILAVSSVTGEWYELSDGNFIHTGCCCDER